LAVLSLRAAGALAGDTDHDCSGPLLVTVTADGGCVVGKVVAVCESVGPLLRSMGLRTDCEVRVAGGPLTHYQPVGALLQSLQDAGFIKVAFASKLETPPDRP
jgi:biopolymer transport protein ExbD